jgi:flagellar protein FlaG
MTFEIGQLTIAPVAPASRPAAPHTPAAVASAAHADPVDWSDVIPASPPPEVLAEVDAAWQRGAELAAQNRELHFERDAETGRTIIQVRSLDGEVLRTIPASKALDVMSGGAL